VTRSRAIAQQALNGLSALRGSLHDPDLLVHQAVQLVDEPIDLLIRWRNPPLRRFFLDRRAGRRKGTPSQLAIDITPMAHVINDHLPLALIDGVDHSIIADTDTVQLLRPGQFKRPARKRIVLQRFNAFKDAPRDGRWQRAQVLLDRRLEDDLIGCHLSSTDVSSLPG